MAQQNGVVDLDELVKPKRVRLGGKEYTVKDLDGVGYQLLKKMREEGPESSTDIMYEIAALSLPDLPQADVLRLTAVQIGKVLELAAASVEMVEASIPKGRTARKKGAASP